MQNAFKHVTFTPTKNLCNSFDSVVRVVEVGVFGDNLNATLEMTRYTISRIVPQERSMHVAYSSKTYVSSLSTDSLIVSIGFAHPVHAVLRLYRSCSLSNRTSARCPTKFINVLAAAREMLILQSLPSTSYSSGLMSSLVRWIPKVRKMIAVGYYPGRFPGIS